MDIVEYKCPNCTADLKFQPSSQRLSCDYCGGSFTIEEIKKIFAKTESSLDNEQKDKAQTDKSDESEQPQSDDFSENTKLYHCSSCGAEIMATTQQTALFCYYCHNPVILSGKMTGKFRPKKVIGFKVSRDEAIKTFKKWCFKRFVPKDFKTDQQLEKITGLYVPFWLSDGKVKFDFSANGYKVRRWTSGSYDYTETKEFLVKRNGKLVAEGVPADGSKRIEDSLMEAIEPFDYSEMQDFSMSYLSGFFAEKYDMDDIMMLPNIKNRLSRACKKIIMNTVKDYSSVKIANESYDVSDVKMDYAMLPVWFMSYKYKEKVYEFVMNGQTGKIAGTPPLDKGKLRLYSWTIMAACSLLTAFAGCLLLGGIF